MFVVKENYSYQPKITVLERTKKETSEKVFWGFIEHTIELNFEQAQEYWREYLEENEMTETEMPMNKLYSCKETNLRKQRLFECSNTDESRIFGYDGEPDWNEMLEYVFGSVTNSRGAEARYFIDEI